MSKIVYIGYKIHKSNAQITEAVAAETSVDHAQHQPERGPERHPDGARHPRIVVQPAAQQSSGQHHRGRQECAVKRSIVQGIPITRLNAP